MIAPRRVVCLLLALLWACFPVAGTPYADRGIGGTGAPAAGPQAGPQISDRGIGGTGIVGVVTGFGSVFVNGLEIAYDSSTTLTVDGESDAREALQVGQVAAIVASNDHGLHAVSIEVRHEVSGPVTSVGAPGPDGRMLTVAGQQVMLGSGTDGLQTVNSGDWVAVSGFRQPDGVIAASRIDQRSAGTVLVRGAVTSSAGGWSIGSLGVQPPNVTSLAPGESVIARGTIENGALSVTTARPDILGSDPAAFFGSHVQRMVIEGYVSAADGHVRLGRGWLATPAPGIAAPVGTHRAIVELERGADGRFIATHLRGAGRGAGRPGEQHRAPSAPERHGFRGPPGAVPHTYRPTYYRPHPWQNRRPGFGYRERGPRRGCAGGGCRGGRRPR